VRARKFLYHYFSHICFLDSFFFFIYAEEIQEVQRRHSALSEKVNHFKEEFNKLKERFPENGQQFERHISNWKLSASHLYGMKVNQLNNCRNSIHGITEVNLPNTDLDEIYMLFAHDFKHLVQTGVYHGKEADSEERLLMARWCDLMLDFFLDLKELGILPKPNPEKYSSQIASQFVLSYVLGKFPPYDTTTAYINLNLKTSILLDRYSRRIKDLAQGQF
jgi:hypothetical protein